MKVDWCRNIHFYGSASPDCTESAIRLEAVFARDTVEPGKCQDYFQIMMPADQPDQARPQIIFLLPLLFSSLAFWSAHLAGGRVNSVWATVSATDYKWTWDIGDSPKWHCRHYFRWYWAHVEKDKALQSQSHFSGCYWLQMKLGVLVFSVPAEGNSGWAMTISTCWPKPRIWSCISSWKTLKASASTPNTISSMWQMSSYDTGCQLADTGTGSDSKMNHKWRIIVN